LASISGLDPNMRRFLHTQAATCFLALVFVACSGNQPTTPPSDASFDHIGLLAWKETLGPSYPITIRGADSIATVTRFVDPAGAAWRDTSAFPGTPILAGFYVGDDLRAEYGFVETTHASGGFLVGRVAGRIRVRAASAADISRFLAFFGVAVAIEP
jgi:hypothetical protein